MNNYVVFKTWKQESNIKEAWACEGMIQLSVSEKSEAWHGLTYTQLLKVKSTMQDCSQKMLENNSLVFQV